MSRHSILLASAISLSLLTSAPVLAGDACTAAGVPILEDAAGDWSGSLTSGAGTPEQDLLSLAVGQTSANGETLLHFTLKAASGPTLLPPNAVWYVSFVSTDDAKFGVRLQTDDSGVPSIFSYRVANGGLQDDGPGDGRFVVDGSELAAESGSGYSADGTFTFVVKAADVGISAAGQALYGFNAASIQGGSAVVVRFALTMDEMPDGLSRDGIFEVGNCGDGKSGLQAILGGAPSLGLLLPLALIALLRRKGCTKSSLVKPT